MIHEAWLPGEGLDKVLLLRAWKGCGRDILIVVVVHIDGGGYWIAAIRHDKEKSTQGGGKEIEERRAVLFPSESEKTFLDMRSPVININGEEC